MAILRASFMRLWDSEVAAGLACAVACERVEERWNDGDRTESGRPLAQ